MKIIKYRTKNKKNSKVKIIYSKKSSILMSLFYLKIDFIQFSLKIRILTKKNFLKIKQLQLKKINTEFGSNINF
jgi:hypothetical protein